MTTDGFDAVVVGSGAGGAACAWGLTRRGLRVLLLEAGPAYDPLTDYALHRATWEREGFPARPSSEGRYAYAPMQKLQRRWRHLRSWNRLSGAFNRTGFRQPLGYKHVRGVGGSTLHFSGEAHRLHPESMRMGSRFGVAADWPLTYAELEPYYCEAERIVGVAGPESDPVRWRSSPPPLPPHPPSYASRRLGDGLQALSLSWTPSSVAILSAPYDGRPPCNYCGQCQRGCPRTDKGSADVTFVRKAIASTRCTLRTGCQVTRLEAGADDRVAAVHFVDADGHDAKVAAPVVVLACGAVETPRLLLCSESTSAPNGLANESGLVGRNFMETLAWQSAGLHPERLDAYRGIPSDSVCWDFNAPDAIPDVVGGCRFSHGTIESGFGGPIEYAKRVAGGWGEDHQKRMAELFGHVLAVAAIGEFLPNDGSFVDLDPDRRDGRGLPLARIHSHLPDRELARLSFMAEQSRRILDASGVDEVFEEIGSYDLFSATHVFGTCRMGSDPALSVVDAYGGSHRWRNLYVADASLFPSSGGGESPSLTIEALAIRTADRIALRASRREV